MFFPLTCCDVYLFIGFYVGDSNGNIASIVIHDNGFLFYCTRFNVAHSESTRHISVWCIDSITVHTVNKIIKNVKIL